MNRTTLLFAVSLAFGISAKAQSMDYAPSNWKFADMAVGSAKTIFMPEKATTKWNLDVDGTQGFRLHYNSNGGIALANYEDGKGYAAFSDAQKARFNNFYESAQIIDLQGEKVLALTGTSAPSGKVNGAVKASSSFSNATLFFLSGTEVPVGHYYRLTLDYRAVTNITDDAAKYISFTLATNKYDGIDKPGKIPGTSEYRSYGDKAAVVSESFNDYWTRVKMDFWLEDNTDPNYLETPLVIKTWLGGGIYDNTVLLIRSIKLEQISNYDPSNVPGSVSEVDDFPRTTGVGSVTDNGFFVMPLKGALRVASARQPVYVYNASGVLIAQVEHPKAVEDVSVPGHGVYIVKCGSQVRKVNL